MSDGFKHTILLVEADTILRRLIVLGLRGCGMDVIEADTLIDVSEKDIVYHQPELVILDIDSGTGCDWPQLTKVQDSPFLSKLPIVTLSWETLSSESLSHYAPQTQVTCQTKPFDARALYTAVEQLLAKRTQEAVSQVRMILPAPSLCPIIAAAGLLLVSIGLMVNLALSAIGVLALLAALVYWSLDTRSEERTAALPT